MKTTLIWGEVQAYRKRFGHIQLVSCSVLCSGNRYPIDSGGALLDNSKIWSGGGGLVADGF